MSIKYPPLVLLVAHEYSVFGSMQYTHFDFVLCEYLYFLEYLILEKRPHQYC